MDGQIEGEDEKEKDKDKDKEKQKGSIKMKSQKMSNNEPIVNNHLQSNVIKTKEDIYHVKNSVIDETDEFGLKLSPEKLLENSNQKKSTFKN